MLCQVFGGPLRVEIRTSGDGGLLDPLLQFIELTVGYLTKIPDACSLKFLDLFGCDARQPLYGEFNCLRAFGALREKSTFER